MADTLYVTKTHVAGFVPGQRITSTQIREAKADPADWEQVGAIEPYAGSNVFKADEAKRAQDRAYERLLDEAKKEFS